MKVHVVNPHLGFGNIVMKLCDFIRKAGPEEGYVDENLKDFCRGRAFNFNVKFIKGLEATMDGDIYCNETVYKRLSSALPILMPPSQELVDAFNAKAHLLEGVSLGIHVRCGSAMPDCKGLSLSHVWFASEETFKTLRMIIYSCRSRVFLASDSKEVKKMFMREFGDKIVTFDSDITLSCEPKTCGGVEQSSKSLMDTYLEWFTLSKFPDVVTTAGPEYNPQTHEGVGVSTFGFTAAAYGQKTLYIVFYTGHVVAFTSE